MVCESEHLRPCGEFEGEFDDGKPDAVLVEAVQRKVVEPSVFRVSDSVFAAGAAAMPQFEVLDLSTSCVGGECSEPQSVGIGEAQLSTGMRSLLSDDHTHSRRPRREVEDAGGVDDPGPSRTFSSASIAADHALSGTSRSAVTMVSVSSNPIE